MVTFSRKQLRALGNSWRDINSLLAAGTIRRIAFGWYSDSNPHPLELKAAAHGARLCGLSACEYHGLWVPPQTKIHLAISASRPARKPVPGVEFHRIAVLGDSLVTPLGEALRQVIRWHDLETCLVVIESAIYHGKLKPWEIGEILGQRRVKDRLILKYIDPHAESGTETRLRLFFQRRRIPVQSQLNLGYGRVDLLIGRRWVIEADSQGFHSDIKNVNADCAKDLGQRLQGYMCERLSYAQVWKNWERTQRILLGIVKTRAHLRKAQPRLAGHGSTQLVC